MKDEIIQHLFNRLTPSQQADSILTIREVYVLTDTEICRMFGITNDELQIILSRGR